MTDQTQRRLTEHRLSMDAAFLFSGGYGGRAGSTGVLCPKDALDLNGEPIIVDRVQELLEAGYKKVVIVSRRQAVASYESVFKHVDPDYLSYLRNGNAYKKGIADRIEEFQGYPVEIVVQDDDLPYGNFSPIYTLYRHGYLKPDYAYSINYADDGVKGENAALSLVDAYNGQNMSDVSVLMMGQDLPANEVASFGTFDFADKPEYFKDHDNLRFLQGRVKRLAEKADSSEAPSTVASLGRYILPYEIIGYAISSGYRSDGPRSANDPEFKEFNTVTAINAMAVDGYGVMALGTRGQWLTTGDVDSLAYARAVFALDNRGIRDRLYRYISNDPVLRGDMIEIIAK